MVTHNLEYLKYADVVYRIRGGDSYYPVLSLCSRSSSIFAKLLNILNIYIAKRNH